MKATIDGITYEGTEDEIRHIVENPPHRPPVQITWWDGDYSGRPMPPVSFPTREYPIQNPIVVTCSIV